MKRPNILIIYTDQQRADTIGYGGNNLIHTPNLDALAKSGALFENMYVNCPVCMPSRMSMLSGRYPASLRIACNGIPMPKNIPCLHNILKKYGYRTANIGKLHFMNHSDRDHSLPHDDYGFDVLINSDEPGCYNDAYIKWVEKQSPEMLEKCRCTTPPHWTGKPVIKHPRNTNNPYLFEGPEELTHTSFVAEETCNFIKNQDTEPFFCIAGFYAPHTPLNPPRRFVEMYDEEDMPLPIRNNGENFEDTSDRQWQKVKTYYYALISHIDDQVGKIIQILEKTEKLEDTLIIFTSDHGEYLGDHGRIQKCGPEDSSAKVPLIISYPGKVKKTQRYQEITEGVDIAPTVLDYCGIQKPVYMQGQSLKPLMENKDFTKKESAFIELKVPYTYAYKAIRTKDFLYYINNNGEEYLYDMKTDPGQLNNLSTAPQYTKKLSEMRKKLLERYFSVESQEPLRSALY
jgi:arylsulfatase